jgi:DNA-binding protein HU-beta
MTRAEFVRAVQVAMDSRENGLPQTAIKTVLEAAGKVSRELLDNGKDAEVVGLGILKVVRRAAREGRNPRTGELIKIPAKRAVKFRASKVLKDALNK